MINSIEFYCGMSREMKALKCSEMCVKTDDMIELITRLRQAEKDAARYRFMRDMSDNIDVSGFFWIDVSERDAFVDEAMQCK